MKPIRVRQCKDDCCLVQVPSRRFWYIDTPMGRETYSNFREAIFYAAWAGAHLPQEVTA
jgi:hypothetical protein